MRRAVSNLAFDELRIPDDASALLDVGITAIEIAPTVVWPDAPHVSNKDVDTYARNCRRAGLGVSGVQSLLFGHPELRVFDRATWPRLLDHLREMVRLADRLGAGVAVFGSPTNRVKGPLTNEQADETFGEFLEQLIPALSHHGVVLTLEPNAPDYGADYLTHYSDVVRMTDQLRSEWVKPQIDTGCGAMVGDDPVRCAEQRAPAHVHVSTPFLKQPPGAIDHASFHQSLTRSGYDGWVVLEMRDPSASGFSDVAEACRWLEGTYP